ncbi:hypothetical protein D6817_03250 [Candidatus Pacearchaeota archaeon]|nr:MAG: hypothetical protein D6817_03250 [Candidatus Pacearchaeota archaeon]
MEKLMIDSNSGMRKPARKCSKYTLPMKSNLSKNLNEKLERLISKITLRRSASVNMDAWRYGNFLQFIPARACNCLFNFRKF